MSGNCELGRGLRSREKNANVAGAGRFEKPAPDARAAPPEAHESLIGRKTVEEVPLTGLSFGRGGTFPSIVQRSLCRNSCIVTVGSSSVGWVDAAVGCGPLPCRVAITVGRQYNSVKRAALVDVEGEIERPSLLVATGATSTTSAGAAFITERLSDGHDQF